jgi:1-acyl-sn-glycerol-3-phosphate acyltransferase
MVGIAETWISGNDLNISLTQNIHWKIDLPADLSLNRSYLVCSNHQSWVDIVILQHVFNRKIPFLRFFLKKQLLYVPFLGGAWWALDYPFMKRYSKEYLERHPEKRGEDLRTTQKALSRFKDSKVSILNFLEGTRFTEAKHDKQKSPYHRLLLPKAGGFAFALQAMKNELDTILDVTIVYPQGVTSLWAALCGELKEVVVHVREIPTPQEFFQGSYLEDAATRERFQRWVTDLWIQKDQLIEEILTEKSAQTARPS